MEQASSRGQAYDQWQKTEQKKENRNVVAQLPREHSTTLAAPPEWKMPVSAKILFNAISFFSGEKMTNYKALHRPKLSLVFLASVLHSISSKFLITKKRKFIMGEQKNHGQRLQGRWPPLRPRHLELVLEM